MPSKLLAETLLRDINKAQTRARYATQAARDANEASVNAYQQLTALLGEARRHDIHFKQDPVSGKRELDPPTKGWDE